MSPKSTNFEIKRGHDGKLYAVFRDSYERDGFAHFFPNARPACFGQFDNAFELPDQRS